MKNESYIMAGMRGKQLPNMWLVCFSRVVHRLLRTCDVDLPVCESLQGTGHSVNQDSAMVTTSPIRMVVADGISAGCCSEVASLLAVRLFGKSAPLTDNTMIRMAVDVDRLLLWLYGQMGQDPGGTTLLVAEERKNGRFSLLNIGDSRAFLLSPTLLGRYRCRQITVDQTWGERKKRMDVPDHDHYPDNVMFHAVGYGLEVPEVAVTSVAVPIDGYLVLATDGAFKRLGPQALSRFAEMADQCDSGEDLKQAIIQRALSLGESDDISIAVYSRCVRRFLGARPIFWLMLLCSILSALIK